MAHDCSIKLVPERPKFGHRTCSLAGSLVQQRVRPAFTDEKSPVLAKTAQDSVVGGKWPKQTEMRKTCLPKPEDVARKRHQHRYVWQVGVYHRSTLFAHLEGSDY